MRYQIVVNILRQCCVLSAVGLLVLPVGCGTTLSRGATEQLLTSDAVDRSISQIDFRDLSGKKVYLDTKYVKTVKGVGFVNADYIISSLRQQMVAAELLLQDKPEDADYIVEFRVGAVGTNGHEVTYGIPQSASLTTVINTAASMVPTMPAIPALPEIAVAKKNHEMAAVKLSVFAYHRETRRPVWQSGISLATSTAKDTWIFGAGPFQSGTIYDGPQFAGNKITLPFFGHSSEEHSVLPVAYDAEYHFKETEEVAMKPIFSELPRKLKVAKVKQPSPKREQGKPKSQAHNLMLLSNEIETLQEAEGKQFSEPHQSASPQTSPTWWESN